MNDLLPQDFELAGRAVLAFLRDRFGFDLWMLTRAEGDDWIVLQAEDLSYGVQSGKVFRWADSFCAEMVKGNGPRVAPNSELVPAYRAAQIAQQFPIKAYIGMPLQNADGSLFGTLCAINPTPQPESIRGEQALLELLAGLLSQILQADLKAAAAVRRTQYLEAAAHNDALTSVYNRRAWDELLAREEDRCKRYGHPAAIISIDLDELKNINDTHGHAAGDALPQKTSNALRKAVWDVDVVARLGGDEFGIIAVECNSTGLAVLVGRIRQYFADDDIKASVGACAREHGSGLTRAWETADRLMYEEKKQSRAHVVS
jgi:diguanylate cyclase